MKIGKYFLVLLLILITFNTSPSITARTFSLSHYMQTTYDSGDGLHSDEDNCILQTEDGYIWIASYSGLSRYNGHTFKTYTNLSAEHFSINNVIVLFEDAQNRLWIGTNNSGIYLYEKGTFSHIVASEGLSSLCVTQIKSDYKGNILIGTRDGLFTYIADGVVVPYEIEGFSLAHPIEETTFSNSIEAVTEDYEGNLWFSSSRQRILQLIPNAFENISFMAGLDEMSYKYFLEGFDEQSVHLPSMYSSEISYTNLPSGTYTFHIKAINSTGLKSEDVCLTFQKEHTLLERPLIKFLCVFFYLFLFF